MIYDLQLGFCFVHIPRTGGVSISRALLPHLTEHAHANLVDRHTRAIDLLREIGPHNWKRLFKFAVLRDPLAIIESDWRLTLRDASRPESELSGVTTKWLVRCLRVAQHLQFERFVEEDYLGKYSGVRPGGFWRTWCLAPNGDDLGIKPVPFDLLGRAWPVICAQIGILPTPLRQLNAAPGEGPKWPEYLKPWVLNYCAGDVELIERLRDEG